MVHTLLGRPSARVVPRAIGEAWRGRRRRPSTQVPLRLPRSSTSHPTPSQRSCACRLETCTSGSSSRHVGARPMTSVVARNRAYSAPAFWMRAMLPPPSAWRRPCRRPTWSAQAGCRHRARPVAAGLAARGALGVADCLRCERVESPAPLPRGGFDRASVPATSCATGGRACALWPCALRSHRSRGGAGARSGPARASPGPAPGRRGRARPRSARTGAAPRRRAGPRSCPGRAAGRRP